MRKFLLTLTAGIMTAAAFGPAAQAAWVWHRPVVTVTAPIAVAPVYVAPGYAAPVYVAPAPVVYAPPLFAPLYPPVIRVHHWHDGWVHRS